MIQIVEKQPDIVFSAEFHSGDKGTYKYSIGNKDLEKISEDILQELSYSENYETIIAVKWEDDFQGLVELNMKDYTYNPIIDLETLNKCAKNIGLDEIKYRSFDTANIHMPKYFKDGYTFFGEIGEMNFAILLKKMVFGICIYYTVLTIGIIVILLKVEIRKIYCLLNQKKAFQNIKLKALMIKNVKWLM